MNLIPLNESNTQRVVEDIGTRTLERIDVSKLTVSPLTCDVSVLPHLALAFDVSIEGLQEQEARDYLQNAREIKKYIGSTYAVKKAAASIFGDDIEVLPWNKFGGEPCTYKFEIDVNEKPVNDENIEKTIKLVDIAKRTAAHLSGITVNMKNNGVYKTSCFTTSSEVGFVYPKPLEDINSSLKYNVATTVYMIEKTVIKPQGVVL
ncbi:phage tail protein I [Malaciobacter marinus]|uniref:phage tail protein I n=1 Tax=Malaciobacter marinus TaxID=505249 RepID=UPI003AFFC095